MEAVLFLGVPEGDGLRLPIGICEELLEEGLAAIDFGALPAAGLGADGAEAPATCFTILDAVGLVADAFWAEHFVEMNALAGFNTAASSLELPGDDHILGEIPLLEGAS